MTDELAVLLDTLRWRQLPAPSIRQRVRKSAGLTQSEVALLLGVDRSSVSRYESNARTPSRRIATRYSLLLARLIATTAEGSHENGPVAAGPFVEQIADEAREHASP
jgi:transcriptional regulator with XRE-family HTH domain